MEPSKQVASLDSELGPTNKEAGDLINALHQSVNFKADETDTSDPDVEHNNTGVGLDKYGKYSFANLLMKGKHYFIQVRESAKIKGFENYGLA